MANQIKHKEALINVAIAIPATLMGGAVGAAVGRPSLAVGLAAIVGGYYLGQVKSKAWGDAVVLAGAGMMISHVASGPSPAEEKGVDGIDGFATDAKARLIDFGKALGRKAYLDKIPAINNKLDLSGLAGLGHFGNVSYYTEPDPQEVSPAEADRIINELLAKEAVNGPMSDAYNLNGPMSDAYGLKGIMSNDYNLNGLEAIGVTW